MIRILYLIGNGFDKNLGLATSYPEFYKYYLKEPSKDENVVKFKNILADKERYGDVKLWADLELLLGKCTEEFDSVEAFSAALLDVNESLRQYIDNEGSRVIPDSNAHDKFIGYLLNPQSKLSRYCRRDFDGFVNSYGNDWKIDFMSFNYTYSLERLLEESESELGKNFYGGKTSWGTIRHIHGVHDGTILLGVNDESQIANKTFRGNRLLLRKFVKPIMNNVIEELVDDDCVTLITKANLIICFGLSFGATDGIWWKAISQVIPSNNKRLFLYDYNPNANIEHQKFLLGDLQDALISKMMPSADQAARAHTYYLLNTSMFSGLDSCVGIKGIYI